MARAENDTEGLTEPQRLWVEALRSGKYKQAQNALCRLDDDGEPVGWCCLGVACDVALKAGVKLAVEADGRERVFDGAIIFLPTKVREWLGLRTETSAFGGHDADALSARNDDGESFEDIATLIESRPEGLFR